MGDVPLYSSPTLHFRATCDACGAASEVICTDLGIGGGAGRVRALERLAELGWQHAVAPDEPAHSRAWVAEQGAGLWTCPVCVARRTAPCADARR